jgi:hypothetical protein
VSTSLIPAPYSRLVDDAAVFPPGNAPIEVAVAEHLGHLASPYTDLVGPLVIGDTALPRLTSAVQDGAAVERGAVDVAVVVTGGAGAIQPAAHVAAASPNLSLRSVEVALRDDSDLGANVRRVVAALDALLDAGTLDDDLGCVVELPRLYGATPSRGWLAALDEIAARDLRVKLRTGGEDADDFPDPTELATCIDAALEREIAFKCTAGLHRAVRHRDRATGLLHHGFLNVLAATRTSLDGASVTEVADILGLADTVEVTDLVEEAGPDALASARRWFTSFGSCSVLEPLEDLVDLGLVADLDEGTP